MSSEASDFFLIIGVETVGWGLISWRSVYSIMDFCWLWLDVKLVNLHFSITERRRISTAPVPELDNMLIVRPTASTFNITFWKIEIMKLKTTITVRLCMCGSGSSSNTTVVLSIFLYYYLITDVRQFYEIGFIKGQETYQNAKFRRRKYSIFIYNLLYFSDLV